MNPSDQPQQAPEPHWAKPVEPADESSVYLRRIAELEQQVETYEALLNELPDLFERKFQQRLEPLIERYRLLAEARRIWLQCELSFQIRMLSRFTGYRLCRRSLQHWILGCDGFSWI